MTNAYDASGAAKPEGPRVLASVPENRMSAEAITAPYQMVARAVGYLGNVVDEATVDWHRQAAEEKVVTRDADGNVQLEQRPFEFSAGDRAYNAVARQRALSAGMTDVDRARADTIAKHQNDPAGFDAEWTAFTKRLAVTGDKVLRGPLSDYAARTGGEARDKLQIARARSDIEQTKGDILARSEIEISELRALAIEGGTGTPKFQAAWDRVTDSLSSLANNPAYKFSHDRMVQELARIHDDATINASRGVLDRAYAAGGEVAAREVIRRSVTENPELRVTEADRTRLAGVLENRLTFLQGERKAEIGVFRKTKDALIDRYKNSKPVNPADTEAAIERAKSLGDLESAAELGMALYFDRTRLGRLDGVDSLSDSQRRGVFGFGGPAALPRQPPPAVASAIQSAAQKYGVSENLMLRIGWIESRFDPNAQNAGSGAAGLFQFIPSTWGQYGGGANPRDPAANADAAARLILANAKTLRAGLGREPTDGELYLAHQQGAGGALSLLKNPDANAAQVLGKNGEAKVTMNGGTPGMTAGQFAQLWIGKFGQAGGATGSVPGGGVVSGGTSKIPPDLAGNPHAQSAFLRAMTADEDRHIKVARDLADTALNALQHREVPSDRDIAFLLQAKALYPEQLGKKIGTIEEQLSGSWIGRDLLNSSDVMAYRRLGEARDLAGRSGDLLGQRILRFAEDYVGAGVTAMKEDHFSEGASRGWFSRLAPLDFSSPDSVRRGVAERTAAATKLAEQNDGIQVPIVAKREEDAFAAGIAGAKPETIRAFVASLSEMPTPVLDATLRDPNVVSTLKGLSLTSDPPRHKAVMSGLSGLKNRDPRRFADAFGQDMFDKVQGYETAGQYLTDDDLKAELQTRQDPASGPVLKDWQSAADKKAGELDAKAIGQLVAKRAKDQPWGASWGDRSPEDPGANAGMAGDFRSIMRRTIVTARGDPDKAADLAAERLGTLYAISPLNNGTYMKFAPEHYLRDAQGRPATINGTFDWFREQLQSELREKLGSDAVSPISLDDTDAAVPVPGAATGQVTYRLLTYSGTQDAIARGEMPPYMVSYLNPKTGVWNAVKFQPDLEKAMVKERERLDRERADALAWQDKMARSAPPPAAVPGLVMPANPVGAPSLVDVEPFAGTPPRASSATSGAE